VTEMIQQSQAGGNAVTAKRAVFEYNKLNQRTSLTRYQSTGTSNFVAATDYTYDSVNRLSSLTHKQSSTVLAGYTYGYDGASRLTSVTSTIEGLSTYTYDATSQVVGADHAAGAQADETYGYDLNGNRNTSGYTTSTNNRTTADPGFTYTYDDQGNRTSRTETATGKVTEYSWDHRNRLVTVKDRNTAGGGVVKQVDYAYDAFNRLVKRTFDADGAGSGAATNQFWVYDEGINAVLQFDGSSASNLSHRYLWSDRVDELLADETVGSGADTLYALGDHLGTIRDIANFNESTSVTSVTNHRNYNSFGKLVSETNTAVDLIFGYTGKQLDEATGLQHNLFRWYDSNLGNWLSEDPLGFAAGDENLRRYVSNQQVSRIDPTGLEDPQSTTGIYLLISGYGQWPGLEDMRTHLPIANPSTPFASELGYQLTARGVQNTVITSLPVEWDAMNKVMAAEIAKAQKDHPGMEIVWIALGAGKDYDVEKFADNKRETIHPDATGFPAGQNGIPTYNLLNGRVREVNSSAQTFVDLFKAAGAMANLSLDAGDFLCESAAYYIEVMKRQNLIGNGFFMHIPTVKYDGAVVYPQIDSMANALLNYLGPEADPDGDGLPNKIDPEPFKKK
ncbi:MAG: RHS repeat-associated core domain-containing protein, partial [Pirellulaceae bacterium]|nr:RHS repeat-associated core domain-containing protein [Pirellulaceae bacterium]